MSLEKPGHLCIRKGSRERIPKGETDLRVQGGQAMSCSACGASIAKDKSHCVICGLAQQKDAEREWAREVEAAAYEDVSTILETDEAILGITRGRLVGSWKPRGGFNPRAYFTPFANLALTGTRLILQPMSQADGRALTGAAASFPLSTILSMTRSDADVLQPGRTLRLVILLAKGETLRMRASGRMAESADSIVEVWQSLYRDKSGNEPPAGIPCPGCGRELDRPYKFCPYCGKEQEDAE